MTQYDSDAKIVDNKNEKKNIELISRQTTRDIQFSLLVEEVVNNENINEQDENDENNAKSIFKKLRTNINFALNENEIIYHIEDDFRRSCISIFVKREIFRLVHDENHHSEVYRNYDRISSILYISRLFRKIRKYIKHCLICQLTQTKRHRFYDELMLWSNMYDVKRMNLLTIEDCWLSITRCQDTMTYRSINFYFLVMSVS